MLVYSLNAPMKCVPDFLLGVNTMITEQHIAGVCVDREREAEGRIHQIVRVLPLVMRSMIFYFLKKIDTMSC